MCRLYKVRVAALSPPAQLAPDTARSIKVVLEDLLLLGSGAKGGYFYNIYLNLPDVIEDGQKYLLGTVGPFEIAGASHPRTGYAGVPCNRSLVASVFVRAAASHCFV